MDGLFVIDKRAGVTSREVDNRAKKLLNEKGVGHLGTLDPFATGVLVLGIGKGTKIFSFLEDLHKTYEATLVLGEETDTMEGTGTVLETKEVPVLTEKKIKDVFSSFLGKQQQIPPAFSAKHVDGKRAYELAREGKRVELKPQDIEIYSLNLLSFSINSVTFRAEVSKGTYIRVLGSDIAKKLGTVGHLSALRRTAVGPFKAEDAIDIEDIGEDYLIPLEEALPEMTKIIIETPELSRVLNGHPLYRNLTDKYLQVFTPEGKSIAVYQYSKPGEYKCSKFLFVPGK